MYPGINNALKIFHIAIKQVNAYKDFLSNKSFKYNKIQSPDDFKKIPLVDKKNYLTKYALTDLVLNNKIPYNLSSSSGSSGRPFYWPWGLLQEKEGAIMHLNIFENIFNTNNKDTLVIVAFSMGTWIAGTYTTACCRVLSSNGKNIHVISPGIEKEDVLSALINVAPKFSKVILAGYPPFLMDVINEANERGIKLKKLDLSLLFAGEHFSEEWRAHIHKLAGIKDDLRGSVNIYGTADAAMLGSETPLSIYLRNCAEKDSNLAKLLWGNRPFSPTVIQYDTHFRYFEIVDDEIVITVNSGIPLIRYNIHDRGSIYTHKDLRKILSDSGYKHLLKTKLWDHWNMPFLFLFGRSDVSLTFYAVNIYPQNIKLALESDILSQYITGRFVAQRLTRNNGKDQIFYLNIELNQNVESTQKIKKQVAKVVVDNLVEVNSEFRRLFNAIGLKAYPEVRLLKNGNSMFSVHGSKIKWVKK